ncbi:MAG: bifunctional phosphoglucose/phosphomannose isomerase [Chitinophagaceae bacterium]|nr:bifunctional phosphoglucose/phosphomannose isomerase [Chitinophagaceae bacterium]
MKKLVEKFSEQLVRALEIGRSFSFQTKSLSFDHVVVSGLGGSGIGASIVQEYVYDKLKVPFVVNKNYFIPAFVGSNTLFIACSYSGNTEETQAAVEAARRKKAVIVCITSGGALAAFARKHQYPLIELPGEMPPRACLGYSLVQLLFVLKSTKLIKPTFESEIHTAIISLNKNEKKIQKDAAVLAAQLKNKYVAIYGIAGIEGLTIRFRQQLNENCKVLSWHNVIPEMTHNEIVGWRSEHPDLAVVTCYHKGDYDRNLKRLSILKKLLSQYTGSVYNIELKGDSYWERAFYFIHLTDWVSVFLSEMNGHDAMEVKVIDHLKSHMAKK